MKEGWYAAALMRRILVALLIFSVTFPVTLAQTKADSLGQLASDFWAWRAKYRPFTFDDVPRMEHAGGVRDWSAGAIAKQREELAGFERRWGAIRTEDWPVGQRVDYRLMGSALARVRWELDVNPRWERDPTFYLEQTIDALLEELIPPGPFSEARAREIVARAENIPAIVEQGEANLKAIAPFAQLTIEALGDIETRLARVERGVSPLLSSNEQRTRFRASMAQAAKALGGYREWLKQHLPGMRKDFALGEKAFGFFLHRVALLPYRPEELLTMARQDFDRVLAAEVYERQRNLGKPELKMLGTIDEEIARMAQDDAAIRRYLVEHEILTVPVELPHWTMRAAPDYLAAQWVRRIYGLRERVAAARGWHAVGAAAVERASLLQQGVCARSADDGSARGRAGTFFSIVTGAAKCGCAPEAVLRFGRE